MSNEVIYFNEVDTPRVYGAIENLDAGSFLTVTVPTRDGRQSRLAEGIKRKFGDEIAVGNFMGMDTTGCAFNVWRIAI